MNAETRLRSGNANGGKSGRVSSTAAKVVQQIDIGSFGIGQLSRRSKLWGNLIENATRSKGEGGFCLTLGSEIWTRARNGLGREKIRNWRKAARQTGVILYSNCQSQAKPASSIT